MITSQLKNWQLVGKRILLRADLNVPLSNGSITDDFRLRKVEPTLQYILQQQGSIILITHLGRPKTPTPSLSTYCLMPWFLERSYPIYWASTIAQAHKAIESNFTGIILLENLRFFPEEKNHDCHFAQELASLGDYFVNDAFGSMHNNDTSITLVPTYFSVAHKSIGFLVEQELKVLMPLVDNPPYPFVVILGGAKIADKIPYIPGLLNKVSTLMIAPALSFTFLKSLHIPVGSSLVDDAMIPVCQQIMVIDETEQKKILLPRDYQISTTSKTLKEVDYNQLESDQKGISIGQKTIGLWSSVIKNASLTLFNGAIGFADWPETQVGIHSLFDAMAHSSGRSIVTGGDSVGMVEQFGMGNAITFLSSGGGATLHLLSNGSLAGLNALLKNGTKT